MEKITRKVEVLWKYNPNAFEKMNNDVLGQAFRKIGSSIGAVSKMVEQSEMLRFLMPEILSVDPNSKDVNWDSHVKHYWDSLSIDVPSGGKVLETGLNFDIDNIKREKYINRISKEKKLETSKDLAEYVMGFKGDKPNVPEELRWMYAQPINVEDYLLWRYILNYKHVANDITFINRSPHIRFYIHTQEERERVRKTEMKLKTKALESYMKFVGKAGIDDYNDILSVLTPKSIKDIVKNTDLEDKQAALMEYATGQPNKFISVIDDKNLAIKASIQRMISFGVLKQLSGSTVIVESADPAVIIGNNIGEAISFVNNEKNKAKVNELTAKYKSIKL